MRSAGQIVSALLVAWVATDVEGFVSSSRRAKSRSTLSAKNGALVDCEQQRVSLRFSHSFQRHVVYDANRTVLGSYEFLDSALEDHPTAALIPQGTQTQTFDGEEIHLRCFAGSGVEEQTAYRQCLNQTSDEHSTRVNIAYDALTTLSKLAAEVPQAQDALALYLAEKSGILRFLNHSPETITANWNEITRILKNLLEMDASYTRQNILSKFPQLCLYDSGDIVERLYFFLAPLPSAALLRGKGLDWPLLASQGYGAGLSKEQLREALRAVPHIMAVNYEDAALKPAIGYYLHVLQAPFHLANTATIELKEYLDGAMFSDIAHITFLNKLGISWDQLRIILAAFPTLVVCDTHPSVEMLNKGGVRRDIEPQKLHYFQTRLQLRPTQVKAMLITHTRLGSYSVAGKIKPTLDALQRRLGLTSEDMKKVILRQPSMVGMAVAKDRGFNQRIDFFLSETSMKIKELKRAVVRHPSLLEYSVDSTLRPKFAFLRDELFVPANKLAKVVATTPGILGLSLDENLRPSAESFMDYIEITPKEMGAIVAKAPQILASSWKSNLEPKLRYLSNRLNLDTPKLKHIVKAAPRLLLYNVERSIEPKLLMIDEVLRSAGSTCSTAQVVHDNPGMLVMTNDLLRKRLDLAETQSSESGSEIEGALQPRLAKSSDVEELTSAKRSRTSRKDPNIQPLQQERPSTTSNSTGFLIGDIASSKYNLERGYAPGVIPIVVYVAGRIYPRDSSERVRGSQQTGGVSLFFPQVAYGSPQFSAKFAQISRACFPQRVPETEYEFFGNNGTASVGFPGLWPSRTRTELAACHSALRAVLLLLVQEAGANPSAKDEHFQVDVYTGSEAVWRLLRNETRLLEWGEYHSMKSFKNSTDGSKASNNPDLLFPLSKTVSRMMGHCTVVDQNGNSIRLGKQVTIRFMHASDGNMEDESIRALGALARVAAQWYYAKDNTPVL